MTENKEWGVPFTVYTVVISLNERGPSEDYSYHSSYSDAQDNAKGKSWFGGDGQVCERKAIRLPTGKVYLLPQTLYGQILYGQGDIDLDGVNAKRTKELQDQAIAKMTPEELEAVLKLRDKK